MNQFLLEFSSGYNKRGKSYVPLFSYVCTFRIQIMHKTCRSQDRLLGGRKFIVCLCLLFWVSVSAQATQDPIESGVAKDRWYVQMVPEDDFTQDPGSQRWNYALYLDLGYNLNFNNPGNNLWRSKGTTFKVNEPQVNLALGYISKKATPQSRWGFEFGVQAGVDTQNLVPEPPPAFKEPISHADSLRHLYRANGTYLLSVGNELELTAGLINSFIGYESFLAIQNINYTRGYLLDFVPYFLFGVQGTYPVSSTLDLSLFVVSGWDYLANPNDMPNYGFQAAWQLSPRTVFTQNLYYGPDQEDTSIEFWRFFSDSIFEWKSDRFLLAAAFDVGTEKQSDVIGNPRYDWMAGAIWFGWHIDGPWHLGIRSEFYSDPDGLGTGIDQRLQAYTATLEYTFSPVVSNTIVVALEYRYDRSTGPEGGFFKGDANTLVPDQHQVIFSLMWTFGS